MGRDKATLPVGGTAMGLRIAAALRDAGLPVTILGREPLEGFLFQPDATDYEGPLAALRAFTPSRSAVFVAACDMPGFDPRIVPLLQAHLGESDAAIPLLGERLQPLCALYARAAWAKLRSQELQEARSVMRWIDALAVVEVASGFDAAWVRGANTPDEMP